MKYGIDTPITTYNDFILIEGNYNYSINLRYDLNNLQKIRSFIPTEKNMELLKKLLMNVLGKNKKANFIIGPYGKGKSYIYLILLFVLSFNKKYAELDSVKINVLNELIEKIKKVNPQVVMMINEILGDKITYIPIIINYSYKSIQQTFLSSLNETIEREGLSDLKIFTSFYAAIEKIKSWEKNYPEAFNKLKANLKQFNIPLESFVKKLKDNDLDSYNIFTKIYKKITAGEEFNLLCNDDIVDIYKTFSYKVRETGEYNGVYIVFDEFSKFIDEAINEERNLQLKTIQDIAEVVERNNDGLIFFDGIMHKPFDHYLKNTMLSNQDQFRVVEGRFREIYFINTIKDDYNLVEQVIKKDEVKFNVVWNKVKSTVQEKFIQAKSLFLPLYSEEQLKKLSKSCFPLNPVTLFVLPKLCELIAQNERTLFTFLTGREKGGFLHFIEKKFDENKIELLNVDELFDYFEFSFKKEIFNKKIIDIYAITQRALQLADSDDERKILKALAIFYIVDEAETLPCKEEFLRCALQINEEKFGRIIQNLLNKKILIKRKSNQFLDFLVSRIEDLDEKINLYKTLRVKDINISKEIEKLVGMEFSLPRRYNDNFEMTRYFHKVFMDLKELECISEYKDLENMRFADGYIIYLIWHNKDDITKAIEMIKQLNDKRIVLCISQKPFKKVEELKEYLALQFLIEEARKEQDNLLIYNLEILLEDLEEMIYDYLENLFNYSKCEFFVCGKGIQKKETEKQFSSFLSDICEEVYNSTLIVNNEMINKNNLTPQIQKASIVAIEHILKGNYDIEGKGPEKAILNCTIKNKGLLNKRIEDKNLKKIIEEIDLFFKNASAQKMLFSVLYETLQNPPYGLRRGVIPIYLAFEIKNLLSNAVFYYKDKEVDFTPDIFIKINKNSREYSIFIDEFAIDKENYLKKLENLFNDYILEDNKNRYAKIYYAIKRWYFSLPPITQNTNMIKIEEICFLEQIKRLKREIPKLEQNPFEFVSYDLMDIFDGNSYMDVAMKVGKAKEILDNYLDEFINRIATEIKELIGIDKRCTFASGLKNWYLSLPETTKSIFVNNEINSFLKYVKMLDDYDDKKVVSDLSLILLGIDIYNWNDESYEKFINKVEVVIRNLQEYKNKSIKNFVNINYNNMDRKETKLLEIVEISEIGKTLKNAIDEILDEFGNSINDIEKLNVLTSIILEHLK